MEKLPLNDTYLVSIANGSKKSVVIKEDLKLDGRINGELRLKDEAENLIAVAYYNVFNYENNPDLSIGSKEEESHLFIGNVIQESHDDFKMLFDALEEIAFYHEVFKLTENFIPHPHDLDKDDSEIRDFYKKQGYEIYFDDEIEKVVKFLEKRISNLEFFSPSPNKRG